ncbi:MAG: lamin tail domain-containing protein, partial [Pirellulales bacterium]
WKALPPTPGAVIFAEAGDLNLDGTVDDDDVAGFVLAIGDPSAYESQFGQPVELAGDLDLDGDVDYDDIRFFVVAIDPPVSAASSAQENGATLEITELMASNGATLEDAAGKTPDWIELYNGGSQPINLLGWSLTDDPQDLDKWAFPYMSLDADRYLVVFASGEDRGGDTFRLRTDFHSTPDGTFLVDLPSGQVEVRVALGDAGRPRDDVAIYVQGDLVDTVTTEAGEFVAKTYQVEIGESSGGQLAVRLQDLGGETGRSAIGSLIVTPRSGEASRRFDFGTAESPVESGFDRITPETVYSPQAGYGWQEGTVVSAQDREVTIDELHTAFKLSAKGDYLALVSPDGVVVSEYGPNGTDYPPQVTDVSYGVTPDGPRFFFEPTPGAANGPGQTGFVAETQVSVDRGIFDAPFEVEIATPTPGATIRYTIDGTLPTEANGIAYTDPIDVTGTTTLRAAAFLPGFVPSAVETQTYLFPADVLTQDGSGLVSANWGHAGPDWEVDPEIVNHPDPESRLVVDDLLTLPSLSLVLDFDQMFGEGGIYISGQSVEIATSVELIDPNGVDEFQADASVQIVGGSSPNRWKTDKLSMRLKFNEEFGSGDLEYPVFGDDATASFDTLVIDGYLNNVWDYGGGSSDQNNRAQYLRDVFASDMQRATGGYATHDRFVQLYINGIYWGMHRLHERPDDNFAAAYLGGDNEDYDVIKHKPRDVVQGTSESYLALVRAAQEDLSDPAKYQAVEALLDIDDFIGYMLVNFYLGNTDWAHQNWYASRNRVDPEGRWRFHSWDAEKVMHGVGDNSVRKSDLGGPTGIHTSTTRVIEDGVATTVPAGLITNPEYRLRFADRVHATFFDGGLMTPETAASLYQQRLKEIDRAVVAESARWGDNRREEPYTRGTEWIRERDRLLGSYFPRRTGIVLNQLRAVGLYPDIEAPELNQHGGQVSPTFDLELTAPAGTIYYTTDGSDPRLEGGAIAPTAIEYTGPFRLSGFATVKARTLVDGNWSARDAADFQVISDLPLRISEINFNPHDANLVNGLDERSEDNDRFEFLELVNIGSGPIDLDGVRLAEIDVEGARQGVSFQFAQQTLGAGTRIVVVRDKRTFRSRYGDGPPIAVGDDGEGGTSGEYGGKLSNNGEQLTLFDAGGALIEQFAYGVEGAWPGRVVGRGSSLEVIDTTADYNDPANWLPSSEFGGSPGTAGLGPDGRVVVNEVLAAGDTGGTDQIELTNRTDGALDISNWYVSDSGDDYFKFQVADSSAMLAPGGYQRFDDTELGFSLNVLTGGEIWLLEADATGRPVRFVDRAEYRGSRPGQSQGRWPDGTGSSLLFPMTEPTLGTANSAPVRGPVIVSEVHYHPTELPGYRQNFETGTAEGIVPKTGTWSVEAGRYHVLADPDKADAVALVWGLDRLAKNVTISATVRLPSESTVNKNAVLIFDYRGPTDFKFAS